MLVFYLNSLRNPNVGSAVGQTWLSYANEKAYFKLGTDLIHNNSAIDFGIRDDFYNFWFIEMDKNDKCTTKHSNSIANLHPESSDTTNSEKRFASQIANCLVKLNESSEYNYLKEMFLNEYERCMKSVDDNDRLRSRFNTLCLDIIGVRRLNIEYKICCRTNDTSINSTLCSFENFNTEFLDYNMEEFIELWKNRSEENNFLFNEAIRLLNCVFFFRLNFFYLVIEIIFINLYFYFLF